MDLGTATSLFTSRRRWRGSRMPPRGNPVPRARNAMHWLGGLLLLGIVGAGVVTAGAALWEDVDVRRLTTPASAAPPPIPPAPLPRAPAVIPAPAGFEVAILVSAATAHFFSDST